MKRVIATLIVTAAVIAPSLAQAHQREVVVVREVVRPVYHHPVVIVRHETRPRFYSEPGRRDFDRHEREYRRVDWHDRDHAAYMRHAAWGDRDRDGIPNRFDNRPLNPHGDQDRDGVPNRFDRKPGDYRRY